MPQHKIYGFPFQTKTSQGTSETQAETYQEMTTFIFNFPLSLKIYYGCSNLVNKYEMTFPHSFSNWFFNSFNLKKILFWSMSSLMLCSYFFYKMWFIILKLDLSKSKARWYQGYENWQTDIQTGGVVGRCKVPLAEQI